MNNYSDQLLLKEIIHRLKTRLALANFKTQHGYEKMDLYTLESSLIIKKRQSTKRKNKKYSIHITEEDAANVLVMLHNSSLCT